MNLSGRTTVRAFLFSTVIYLLASLLTPRASAQVTTGTPPYGSFAGGPDVINLANLNAHFTIAVLSKPGRGMTFNYNLAYDSSIWYPVTSVGHQTWQNTTATSWGWTTSVPRGGSVTYFQFTFHKICQQTGQPYTITNYTNWTYRDGSGTPHPFVGGTQVGSGCGVGTTSFSGPADDGSGYAISVTGSTINSLYASDGALINPFTGAVSITDRNGNMITSSNSSGTTSYYDTLSSTTPVLAVSGSGTSSSATVFTYTPPNTSSSRCASTNTAGVACYAMNYTNYTVATNFGISTISEYKSSAPVPLVSSIVLPDGSQYTFNYEPTPSIPSQGACTPYSGTTCTTARIASVTLPTGGTISYTYYNSSNNFPACTTGNNGVFSDGSASCLQRTLNDGSNSNTWTYVRSLGSGAASTTTITDPSTAANQTAVQFQGIYETGRQVYQGSASGTPLRQWTTCYNGNTSNCSSTAITLPITQRNVTDQYGSTGLQCQHNYFYNSVGGLAEQDDYDYGSGAYGALLRKTLITYASLPPNITAFRQIVTVCNGTGSSSSCQGASGSSTGTVVAQTNYNYDEPNTLTSTSGITQHTSVSGSRGNLTSVNYPVSGLTSHFTYYDTGSPNTSQDLNGATTTYTYGTSTADCQMAFPTGITEAITTLTQSYTWNCTGGVMTQLTDENGNNVSTSYTDAYFWRPASITDQAGAITNYCYAALTSTGCPSTPSATQVETYLNFNSGNSTVDSLTTLDGLGRAHVQQSRQGPASSNSNFDSVETDYDALGRVSRVTMPYSGGAGHTNSTVAATTTTYDALSRIYQVTDGGGGTSTYTYSPTSTDVSVAIGPAPTGEHLKQRQSEYDGLGRLTSVCEITSGTTAWPGGTCAQNTATQPTGYWTKYTYDALDDMLTVTQNAQATTANQQTRTLTYDAMSRLTSEVNPESGTTSYTYDTISSGTCASTYHGDLVKRVDAIGNIACYTYDSLRRILSNTYTVNSPTVPTPNKCFVYDAAIDSQTVMNTKARVAEAYTTTSACSQTTLPSNTTDLAFGYSARGEVTDVYEKTPHSGGTGAPYNHTTATFWLSGALNTLGGPVVPTITYALDGEGRTSTISDGSGHGPVTGTTYNPYAAPPQQTVTLGSGDSDVFSFDASTFRLNKYQFKVGSSTVTGTLSWNANGSLGGLNINDPFSTPNTQTCNYAADDLARITRGDCGTIWGQTFSYDPFGNIQKNAISGEGGTSFTPTYQSSPSITNRISQIGTQIPTYDANGNSLNDTFRAFTWDAENRPVTIGSVTLTYDALGRLAEQSVSNTNTEIAYTPLGGKLSLMNGISLVKAFVPLTGGDTAVYTSSSGAAYYRHTDHLGSSRFASTPSQTLYSDTAYSAFGEPYASSGSIDNSFTGQNQDTLAGLYDFMYREHDPNQGRWTQPDPAGLAAVDLANPQSWNRYAYVLNSPLNSVDWLGLHPTGNLPSAGFLTGQGGSGRCILDGIDVPCEIVQGLVGGAFAPGGSASNLPFATTGNDCNSGPCIPFSYWDDNGCLVSVSYGHVSDAGGTYDMPIVKTTCLPGPGNGPQSVNGGGGFKPTVAYSFSLIIPLVYGWAGPAFTAAYVPSQNLVCFGGGGGASIGHSVSVGPVAVDANHTKDVLGGTSLSGGYNLTPYQGAQGSVNTSGSTGGPSFGIPGLSVSVTFSKCKQF